MKKLVERNIDIAILSREGDDTIPKGARMQEEFNNDTLMDNRIAMYHSPRTGHSSLSVDQRNYLMKFLRQHTE